MLIVALALSDLIMIQHQGPCLFIGMFISRYWAFGKLWCKLYGFLGGVNGLWSMIFLALDLSNFVFLGCASLWCIILIGYDRYNVIVNGFTGTKITPVKAFAMIVFAYGYSTLTVLPPLLEAWGSYSLGNMKLISTH